jgi:hypothetical protein
MRTQLVDVKAQFVSNVKAILLVYTLVAVAADADAVGQLQEDAQLRNGKVLSLVDEDCVIEPGGGQTRCHLANSG